MFANADDPVYAQGHASALASAEGRLDTSAFGEAERARSRSEFADANDDEAIRTARETFHPELAAPISDANATLPRGMRIADYRDEHTAMVRTALGAPAGLLISADPLTAEPTGESPIDLSLTRTANGFEPQRARERLTIPSLADQPASLNEIGFDPEVATAAAGTERADRVFYPSVDTDTDYVVQPTPAGLESFWQLRSPDSPDSLRLHMHLPERAKIIEQTSVPGTPTPVRIVKDGLTLAAVRPVLAIDAAHRPVDVDIDVDGLDLVVSVDHRRGDVQYPVLVDPYVETRNNWESWEGNAWHNCGYGSPSGNWWPEGNDTAPWKTTCEPSLVFPYGLQVGAPAGNWFNAGSFKQMNYWAPANTYFSDFWANAVHHVNVYGNAGYLGLFADGQNAHWQAYWESFYGADGVGVPLHDEELRQNRAVFGLRFHTGVNSQGGFIGSDHVGLLLRDGQDPDTPAIAADSPTPEFIDGGGKYYPWNAGTFQLQLKAHDIGLGVRKIGVQRDDGSWLLGPVYLRGANGTRPGTSQALAESEACTGLWASRCPENVNTGWLGTSSPQVREGDDSGRTVAIDAGGRAAWGTRVHFRRDTTRPNVTVSGPLWDARGGELWDDAVPLTVSASDGGSGVKSVRVLVDGAQVYDSGAPCSSPCSWTMYPDDLDGDDGHTISVIARDNVGLESANLDWSVDVDTAEADCAGNGASCGADEPAGLANRQRANVRWSNPSADVDLFVWDATGRTADETNSDGLPLGRVSTRTQSTSATAAFIEEAAARDLLVGVCLRGGTSSANGSATLTRPDGSTLNVAFNLAGIGDRKLLSSGGSGFAVDASRAQWTGCPTASGPTGAGAIAVTDATTVFQQRDPALVASVPAQTSNGLTLSPELRSVGDALGAADTGSNVQINRTASIGFSIGDSDSPISVKPVGVAATTSAALVRNDAAVVHANVFSSVDMLTRPDGDGVETYLDVRGAAAPEAYAWDVSLSSTQSLSALANGDIIVRDAAANTTPAATRNPSARLAAAQAQASDEGVAVMPKPTAKDAAGKSVPVTATVSGSRITLSMPHRGKGFSYPILLDPEWAGFKLNQAEFNYCARHPSHVRNCLRAFGNAIASFNHMRSLFPNAADRGRGDAFRHCTWSGFMNVDIGRGSARRFGHLHEAGESAALQKQDFHNNRVGRRYARLGGNSKARAQQDCYTDATATYTTDGGHGGGIFLWFINHE